MIPLGLLTVLHYCSLMSAVVILFLLALQAWRNFRETNH